MDELQESSAEIKNRAARFSAEGNYGKALEEYEKVLRTRPEDADILNMVGDIYKKMGDKQKAIEMFEKAVKEYTDQAYHDNAVAVCKKILRIVPDRSSITKRLARLYVKQGLTGEATSVLAEYARRRKEEGDSEAMLDAYRDLIAISPRNIALRMKLADEYIGLGKMRGARIQLQEIATLYREEENHEEVSNVEKLISEITPAIDANGEDYWERANAAEKSGETDESVDYYYKAVGQFLGQIAYHLARDAFMRITELKPEELKPWQKLVQIGNALGDKRGIVRAYSGLANALTQRGAADSATAVYEKILVLEPENEDARRALTPTVEAPEEERDVVEAEIPPDSGEVVQEQEEATPEVSAEEEVQEAVETPAGKPVFKVADEIMPEQPIGLDDLISEFKRGVEEYIGDDDYSTHYDLGVSFKEMGRIDEAIAHFKKAARGAKEKLKAYELLGRCHIEKEDFETTIDYLKEGLALEGFNQSEYIGLRYNLGLAYEAVGRTDDALREYRMIESEDPQYFDTPERIKRLSGSMSASEHREENGEADRRRDKISYI